MPKPTNPIRLQRDRLGLTQQQLADASGLTFQRISQLEQGVRDYKTMQVDTAIRIARALKTTVEKLAERDT
jgi:transcriptional regulator with XRE-family HTH domain